jgi:preprotein translocase SecE subunit
MTRIRRFLAEAASELGKVSWPTIEQTRQLTVLVFAVSIAVGVFVLVFDQIFQRIISVLQAGLGT